MREQKARKRKKISIRVSEGCRVRDPINMRPLDPEKIYEVLPTQFWLRRLDAKEVYVVRPEKKKPKKAEAMKK